MVRGGAVPATLSSMPMSCTTGWPSGRLAATWCSSGRVAAVARSVRSGTVSNRSCPAAPKRPVTVSAAASPTCAITPVASPRSCSSELSTDSSASRYIAIAASRPPARRSSAMVVRVSRPSGPMSARIARCSGNVRGSGSSSSAQKAVGPRISRAASSTAPAPDRTRCASRPRSPRCAAMPSAPPRTASAVIGAPARRDDGTARPARRGRPRSRAGRSPRRRAGRSSGVRRASATAYLPPRTRADAARARRSSAAWSIRVAMTSSEADTVQQRRRPPRARQPLVRPVWTQRTRSTGAPCGIDHIVRDSMTRGESQRWNSVTVDVTFHPPWSAAATER